MPPEEHIHGGEDDSAKQGIADASGPEAGQVHHPVREAVRGIDEVEKKGPSPAPDKAVSHCQVQDRRDGFGQETGEAPWLGAIKRKEVVQIRENDEGIVQGANDQEHTEEPDIMPAPPSGANGASPRGAAFRWSEIGIVALECPPGESQHHEEEHFRRTAGDMSESQAGDDECKSQKAGRKSLKITPLQGMARAWDQD